MISENENFLWLFHRFINLLSSYFLLEKCFVIARTKTVQGRILILGIQIENKILFCRIENQPSNCSFMYLSMFISLCALNPEHCALNCGIAYV